MAYQRLVDKLTKENLWLYIIRLLKERPMYGKEIVKEIRDRFNFSPATVTVYVVLYKMVREGLVRKVQVAEGEGKVYYEPTERGLEVFERGKEFMRSVYRSLFGEEP
ncbi:MAG: PadR family transcriptional regulator [Thermoprotei archaeon]|nr:MAG: PadR family transcriptional regulator [Thermoprotei archaeon]